MTELPSAARLEAFSTTLGQASPPQPPHEYMGSPAAAGSAVAADSPALASLTRPKSRLIAYLPADDLDTAPMADAPPVAAGPSSHQREFCHFADALSPSVLKHLL